MVCLAGSVPGELDGADFLVRRDAFGAADQLMIGEGSPGFAFDEDRFVAELFCGAQNRVTDGGGLMPQGRPRAAKNHWVECTTGSSSKGTVMR